MFKPSEANQIPVWLGESAPSSLAGKLWELDLDGKNIPPESAGEVLAYASNIPQANGALIACQVA